ncbi:MAG: DUF2267 domain-containing protein [Gemmatimonadaceae bacterium]
MDELTNLVSERTGIPADKAKMAVTTVLGFLKEKLPAPIAAQLESFMSGNGAGLSAVSGAADSVGKGIESMFGNKS